MMRFQIYVMNKIHENYTIEEKYALISQRKIPLWKSVFLLAFFIQFHHVHQHFNSQRIKLYSGVFHSFNISMKFIQLYCFIKVLPSVSDLPNSHHSFNLMTKTAMVDDFQIFTADDYSIWNKQGGLTFTE